MSKPTYLQASILRRIATSGGMILTHGGNGGSYSYRDGGEIPTKQAKQIIKNGWVTPERDSMFDLTPQSWRAKTP